MQLFKNVEEAGIKSKTISKIQNDSRHLKYNSKSILIILVTLK